MNKQEQQVIDKLFEKLNQVASQQAGSRDAQADAYINDRVTQIPGASYYMAQAIVIQQQALKQAEAKITQLEKQGGSGGGFLPSRPATPRPASSQPAAPSQGGGFLAGAAQTAVGIGGGILLANAGMALFDDIAYDDAADTYDEGYTDAAADLGDDLDLGGGFGDVDFDDW